MALRVLIGTSVHSPVAGIGTKGTSSLRLRRRDWDSGSLTLKKLAEKVNPCRRCATGHQRRNQFQAYCHAFIIICRPTKIDSALTLLGRTVRHTFDAMNPYLLAANRHTFSLMYEARSAAWSPPSPECRFDWVGRPFRLRLDHAINSAGSIWPRTAYPENARQVTLRFVPAQSKPATGIGLSPFFAKE